MSDTADLIEKAADAIREELRRYTIRAPGHVDVRPTWGATEHTIAAAVLAVVAPVLRAKGAANALREAADEYDTLAADEPYAGELWSSTASGLRALADQYAKENPDE